MKSPEKNLVNAITAAYRWGTAPTYENELRVEATIDIAATSYPKPAVYDLCALAYDCGRNKLPIRMQQLSARIYMEISLDDPNEFWKLVTKSIDK